MAAVLWQGLIGTLYWKGMEMNPISEVLNFSPSLGSESLLISRFCCFEATEFASVRTVQEFKMGTHPTSDGIQTQSQTLLGSQWPPSLRSLGLGSSQPPLLASYSMLQLVGPPSFAVAKVPPAPVHDMCAFHSPLVWACVSETLSTNTVTIIIGIIVARRFRLIFLK